MKALGVFGVFGVLVPLNVWAICQNYPCGDGEEESLMRIRASPEAHANAAIDYYCLDGDASAHLTDIWFTHTALCNSPFGEFKFVGIVGEVQVWELYLRGNLLGRVNYDFRAGANALIYYNASGQRRRYIGRTDPVRWDVVEGASVVIPEQLIILSAIILHDLRPGALSAAIHSTNGTGTISQELFDTGCYTFSMFCDVEFRWCVDCYHWHDGGLPQGGPGPDDPPPCDPDSIGPYLLAGDGSCDAPPFSVRCNGDESFLTGRIAAIGWTRSMAQNEVRGRLNEDCINEFCIGCCAFDRAGQIGREFGPDCACLAGDFMCVCQGRGKRCNG
jgi:hypothetical protein